MSGPNRDPNVSNDAHSKIFKRESKVNQQCICMRIEDTCGYLLKPNGQATIYEA